MTKHRPAGVRRALLALVALLGWALPRRAAAQAAPLGGLDDYVRKAMAAWKVPGLALAIVKDDSVIYARGYGVREAGSDAPVDESTIFAIGSSSKAFTTAALAMLVGEGKLSWDDPVTRYLPRFQLHDAYPTRELTVRDLVTHRSGLPRCDLMWYGTHYDRDQVLHRVRFCEPAWSFRSHFGYQNIMFLAAGTVAARVEGVRWDALIEHRIFGPLGMTRSSTSVDSLEGMSDVATPHVVVDDSVRAIPWRNIDNIGPAGSINSSARDMARWLRFQLAGGVLDGDTLVAPDALAETHRPQMVIRQEPPWKELQPSGHFLDYGMGWFLHDYRGREIVEHGGSIDGMRAEVALMPEERLGLVVLTNKGGSSLGTPLMFRIFDAFLGAPRKDWAARYASVQDSMERQQEKREEDLRKSRVEGTEPSLELSGYAGTYADSLYGEVRVRERDGALVLDYDDGAFTSRLEHWNYDTFRARWNDIVRRAGGLAGSLVTFHLDARGRVASLEVPGMGTFDRVPEKSEASRGET
ncbi:MAG TPA: serine hydrolase [Gemmatimonadota bacterium]|nr:serine hydrolase [Gemmatimonadota bacterium]